ncbi:MAG: family 43 glycosylhydrolase, partial [Clostridia bacterium]|nr:family 43 glycosylhydrolase [Clostridia bacterium]
MKRILVLLMFVTVFAVASFAAENPITVYLDNEAVVFDVEPQIINGRTMVPVRAIFEKLGATVTWDDTTKTATAVKGETTVSIALNAPEMTVSGNKVALDSPAVIINSRTLVPLRAVSAAFGCEVGWLSTERRVSLISNSEKCVMLYSNDGSVSFDASEACVKCEEGWFSDEAKSKKIEHTYSNGVCIFCKKVGGNGMTEIANGILSRSSYYQNNLANNAADPFILEHDGTYYLYATGGSRFTVRKSENLLNWSAESEPIIFLSDTTWAVDCGWAPEIYEYNGKFYFIFSARNENQIHCIDIAVCDTPDGKFVPLSDKPFFAPGYSVIDASLLFDDDGRIYLYYSKDCSTNKIGDKKVSQTYGVEVKKDFSGIIGEPVLISTPTYDWELKSGNTLWNEGPVVFKENGVYYLLFSANF